MSLSKKRNRQRATLVGALIGLLIIFTFVISLIAPDLGRRSRDSYPTLTPYGTPPPPTPLVIPTPEPDPQLEGAPPYIHSSGYFQTFKPAGDDWFAYEDPALNVSPYAGVVIQSSRRLVVIHNYIEQGVVYPSVESLSESYLTSAEFDVNWGSYDSWEETRREIVGDKVIIDFNLTLDDNAYLGHNTAWLEDDWLYVSRLVVPANNPDLLTQLSRLVTASFVPYHDLQGFPQEWPIYLDQVTGFVLKAPPSWVRIAGGEGRPATFDVPFGPGKTTVRLWAEADQPLASSDEAEAWIADNEAGVTILGSEPVEHDMGTGYQVAYAYQDVAGDRHSGLVTLLNDADGLLCIANLQLDPADVNLLDVENLSDQQNELRQVLAEGFIVLPPTARR